jgi:hypothetical protein
VLAADLLAGDARSRVALAHPGVTLVALLAKQLPAYETVANVRLGALTQDARSVTPPDAYVVEHSRLFQEPGVERQLAMLPCHLQAAVGHLPAMLQQQLSQCVVGRIVFVYDSLIVHTLQK